MRDPAGIAEAIRAAESVCICGHVNPDGDTIGSALAMRLILLGSGKKAQVFFQDKVPDNLMFLPGADTIRKPETCGERYDLFLAVDVSDPARLGGCAALMSRCTQTAQIDHHGTNPGYTRISSVDGNASATCAMIPEQMRFLRSDMTPEIAVCLYTGISTDTGNFSFSCTDAETFQVMSDLIEYGLPLAELNMRLFRERPGPQLKLLGRAIEHKRYEAGGRLAVMTLTRQDFRDCGALSEHADTLVNFGLETVGTEMALLARESEEEGLIKCSLRARAPLAVDGIAARLGGGGHPQAAGVTLKGSLQEMTERVVQAMTAALETNGESV